MSNQEISKGPNPENIRGLFSSIALGYDKANDVMTLGLARSWRKQLVKWSGAKPGDAVLDCATGTGDLAIEFKKVVGPAGSVVGCDFCQEMLDLAPAKAAARGLSVKFELADVLKLPYPDKSFDVVSIAYGIRNVADPEAAIREMARVCKNGGRVMILETGDSQLPIFSSAVQLYFRKVVPRLGGWITGHRDAYEYLNQSSLRFPSRGRFVALMKSTGRFVDCGFKSLMGGASFIYRGKV